ncbi:hypothetical protein BD414DRAFT_312017 [Trametes punicea]|nr:hypothetical protein BD414DRAFT_312017 [Trametes punicea]
MDEQRQPQGYFIKLQPPPPASVAERLAWDISFRGHLLGGQYGWPSTQTTYAPASVSSGSSSAAEGGGCDDSITSTESTASTTGSIITPTDSSHSDHEHEKVHENPFDFGNVLASVGGVPEVTSSTTDDTPDESAPFIGTYMRTTWHVPPTLEPTSTKLSRQYYSVKVHLAQHVPNDLVKQLGTTTYPINPHLVVDTGSASTWLYGINYQEAYIKANGSYDSRTFSRDVNRRGKDKDLQVNHPLRRSNRSMNTLVNTRYGLAIIEYLDKTIACLTLADSAEPVILSACYKFSLTESRCISLSIMFRFAVAIAVSTLMLSRPYQGILGLGLSFHQAGFPKALSQHAPSFVTALHRQRGELLASVDDPHQNGLVFYFGLRQPDTGEPSWIGLNTWPCPNNPPKWTLPIPVVRSGTESVTWDITLLSVRFDEWRRARGTSGRWDPEPSCRHECKLGEGDSGVRVTLDSGASLSWVPQELVKFVRTTVMPSKENQAIEARRESAPQQSFDTRERPYALSDLQPVSGPYDMRAWRVKLRFKAAENQVTELTIDSDPFLYAPHPDQPLNASNDRYEATMFPSPRDDCYIFGQTFFQSAFVAMHNVNPQQHGQPGAYVRLASQELDKPGKFALPEEVVADL